MENDIEVMYRYQVNIKIELDVLSTYLPGMRSGTRPELGQNVGSDVLPVLCRTVQEVGNIPDK